MSVCLSVCVSVFVFLGLYLFLSDKLSLPSYASVSAVSKLSGHKTAFREYFIYPAALRLKKFVKLNPYRRRVLESQLKSADIDSSPELYIAAAAVQGGLFLIPAFILLLFLPVLSLPFFAAGILVFLKEITSAASRTKKTRELIETEIPRLSAAIGESQRYRKDILPVIESYSKFCEKKFKRELDILAADMKTGNRSEALMKFDRRLNSELVSKLVRGLQGIERGDDMASYMQGVLIEMRSAELSRLSAQAKKRPKELFGANTVLLASVLFFYLTVFGIQLTDSLNRMF